MRKAVFWDLLGTLGGSSRTLLPDFNFYNDTLSVLKHVQDSGYIHVIITNQSHIAHGRLSLIEYEEHSRRLIEECAKVGVQIKSMYMCPHKKSDKCTCKKPKPELIYEAKKHLDIDLKHSFIVGDSVNNDMCLANTVGAKGILVLTGEGKKGLNNPLTIKPDYVAENLKAAGRIITGRPL